MKNFIFSLFLLAGFQTGVFAQYTITLSEACVSWTEVKVKGKITYPASEFATCGYTVELLDLNGKKLADIKINEKTPQGGNFDFTGKIPAGVTFGFPVKVRVTTNRQTSATFDAYRYCGAVRFKNRWRADQYINVEGGPVTASPVQPAFLSAQWELIPVAGTKFFQLKSVWNADQFLNIEKGPLEASNVPAGFHSGHWELETVTGAESFVRIKSRWKPEVYLNVENGKLEASVVPLAFHSANWTLERTW